MTFFNANSGFVFVNLWPTGSSRAWLLIPALRCHCFPISFSGLAPSRFLVSEFNYKQPEFVSFSSPVLLPSILSLHF